MRTYSLNELLILARRELFDLHTRIVAYILHEAPAIDQIVDAAGCDVLKRLQRPITAAD